MANPDPCPDLPPVAPVEPRLPSFHEESYFVADLKEPEKQALHDLKLRIELAIQNNEFHPPAPAPADTSVVDDPPGGQSTAAQAPGGEPAGEGDCGNVAPVSGAKPDTVVETAEEAVRVMDAAGSNGLGDTAKLAASGVEPEEATKETVVECNTPEDMNLWGVPILHTKGDERTDVILLKFLRARDFKVNDAFTMLKNTILWRKSFGADDLLEEDFDASLDSVAYMHGVDKEGHPVCYNVFGALKDSKLYDESFGDEEKVSKFLRWRVRLLETGIRQLDFTPGGATAMVQITDLKNAPGPARKELRRASNHALSLLQDNYPEFVAKKVFINVPWYFIAIYSMFSRFLSQRTKSKLVVARRGKASEALFKLIPPDNVPVQYGGLSRSDETDFKYADTKCIELSLKAGSKQTIEIPVSEAGSVIVWDLTVLGWNILYGAEFVPNAEDSYTAILEKTKKMEPCEQAIRNSFRASEVGKVVLTLDNTLSRRKKTVAYRYIVKALN